MFNGFKETKKSGNGVNRAPNLFIFLFLVRTSVSRFLLNKI